jgi:hypothetical protein
MLLFRIACNAFNFFSPINTPYPQRLKLILTPKLSENPLCECVIVSFVKKEKRFLKVSLQEGNSLKPNLFLSCYDV